MQAFGALIYLCWRRSGHGNSDRAEKRFFGIELSRFSRQKTELPLDDQGVCQSAVDRFEMNDNDTRNHIRDIALRAKALSLESHILKEAAGEQFVRSFMDLLEAEHDYGDVRNVRARSARISSLSLTLTRTTLSEVLDNNSLSISHSLLTLNIITLNTHTKLTLRARSKTGPSRIGHKVDSFDTQVLLVNFSRQKKSC